MTTPHITAREQFLEAQYHAQQDQGETPFEREARLEDEDEARDELLAEEESWYRYERDARY